MRLSSPSLTLILALPFTVALVSSTLSLGCSDKPAGQQAPSPSGAPAAATGTASSRSSAAASSAAASSTASSTAAARPPSGGPVQKPEGFDAKGTLAGGTSIEYRSAVAYKHKTSSAIHIQLSTEKLTCADVTSEEEPKLADGQYILHFAAAPVLAKDGSSSWMVMQAWHSDSKSTESGALGRYADIRLSGEDPSKDIRATVSGWAAKNRVSVDLSGTIVATGCGVVPGLDDAPDAEKARPQAGLTMEIAGKPFPVNGAIYRENRKLLILSTHPLTCSVSAAERDLDLWIMDGGEKARLFGLRADDTDKQDLAKPVQVKLGERAGDLLPMKLDGKFQVGPYAVKLSGDAQPTVCD